MCQTNDFFFTKLDLTSSSTKLPSCRRGLEYADYLPEEYQDITLTVEGLN